MTAHVYGDSAIVTGIYREKGVAKGKPYLRRGRFTDTWVYQNSAWVCVASQSTLIALERPCCPFVPRLLMMQRYSRLSSVSWRSKSA